MLFINETLIKGNLISQTVQKMRTRVLFFDKVTWYCTRPERATSQRKHSTTKYFLKKKEKKKAIKPEFSQTSEHMAIFLVFSVFLVVVVLVAMVWERSLWVSKGRYLYDIGGFLLIQVAFKILFQFQSRGWCLYLLALLEDWKQRLKQFHESKNEYVWFKSDHVFLLFKKSHCFLEEKFIYLLWKAG